MREGERIRSYLSGIFAPYKSLIIIIYSLTFECDQTEPLALLLVI